MTNSRAEYYKKYYEEHKEQKREYNRKYREEHKEEIREQRKEWNKKYYQLNKEKKAEYDKRYRELNKEKIREQSKKWNKEHRREYRKEKKAICLEYLGGKCVKCGATERLEFDHIDRTTKKYTITGSVTNNFDNLKEELNKCQLLCYDCHKVKTKSEKTILRGDGQSVAIV